MKISAMPCDIGGSGCYRVIFPLEQLRLEGGHEATIPPHTMTMKRTQHGTVAPFYAFAPTLDLGYGDLWLLQQQVTSPLHVKIANRLRRMGKRVVVESDDDLFHVPEGHAGHDLIDAGAKHFRWLLREASLVTVSTEALRELYAPRALCNVIVLPNYLQWERWKDVTPQYEVERPRLRVGWYGHIAWRSPGDLDQVATVLGPWLERHPEVDFVYGGSGPEVFDLLGVPDGQRVHVAHVDFPDLPSLVATFDIGIVPLELNAFNECKSYLKGMEMAAAGIPCIAAPTDQYKSFVDEGKTGFLAYSEADWRGALEVLAGDDGLRREMGRAAREKVQADYRIEDHWQLWENAYEEVLGRARVGV